jgi:hypothetical protein
MAYTLTGLFCDAFKQIIFPGGIEGPRHFIGGIAGSQQAIKRTGAAQPFRLRRTFNLSEGTMALP